MAIVKEVRFRPDADAHDIETKCRAIRTWLNEGNTVQLTVRRRGRERGHLDVARQLITDLVGVISDVGRIERDVLLEGRSMTIILAPM